MLLILNFHERCSQEAVIMVIVSSFSSWFKPRMGDMVNKYQTNVFTDCTDGFVRKPLQDTVMP